VEEYNMAELPKVTKKQIVENKHWIGGGAAVAFAGMLIFLGLKRHRKNKKADK
jgi:hypothetical protein